MRARQENVYERENIAHITTSLPPRLSTRHSLRGCKYLQHVDWPWLPRRIEQIEEACSTTRSLAADITTLQSTTLSKYGISYRHVTWAASTRHRGYLRINNNNHKSPRLLWRPQPPTYNIIGKALSVFMVVAKLRRHSVIYFQVPTALCKSS